MLKSQGNLVKLNSIYFSTEFVLAVLTSLGILGMG